MKAKYSNFASVSPLISSVIAVAFTILGHASGADVTWDITPGVVGVGDSEITGGAGVWNTTNGCWSADAGAENIVWINASNDIAIFTDVADVVTLSEPITAGGILFKSNEYSLVGSALTLAGTAPTIAVDSLKSASISSEIQGTVGFNVGIATSGLGTLQLKGTNTYTGVTNVNHGIVDVKNDSAFGSTADGTILAPGSNLATLSFSGGINVVGELLTARGGGVNAAGGLRNVSGDNSWTGTITLSNSLRVTSDSGTITLGDINPQPGSTARSFIANGSGNVTVNGIIGGSGTGGGGNVSVDNAGNVATPGTLTLNGADFYAGTTTVTGGGNLTMAGARTVPSGAITVTQGTIHMTGTRTGASGAITVGNGNGLTGNLNISNGDFTSASITVGTTPTSAAEGVSPGTGIASQSAGTLTASGLILLGNVTGTTTISAGTGTYNLSGGTLRSNSVSGSAICIGTNSGGTGVFKLSGSGNLEMTGVGSVLQIGRSSSTTTSSSGTFEQTGGNATLANIGMGNLNNTNTTSALKITGGIFTVATGFTALAIGANSTAAITIGGTANVTLPAFPTTPRAGTSTATLTLDMEDTAVLRPAAASLAYISNLTNAYLTAKGAKIEVPVDRDITITQAFENATSQVGTLTKSGPGKLTLTGANSYTGKTTVNAGILAVNGTALADSSSLVANGGIIDVTGTETVAALFFGTTQQTAGAWGATGSGATFIDDTRFSGTGVVNVTGGAVVDTDPDHDGISTLMESVLGGDPHVASTSILPVQTLGATELLYAFNRTDASESNTTQIVQFSTNMIDWINFATIGNSTSGAVTVTENGGANDSINVAIPRSNGPAGKLFARLKVTQP